MGFLIVGLCIGILCVPQLYYWWKQNQYNGLHNGERYFISSTNRIEDDVVFVKLTNTDGFEVAAYRYDVAQPKGVVQIVHGAFEHAGRYRTVIEYLRTHGYAVITSDNRGHGRSIHTTQPTGYSRFADETVGDLYIVTKYMKSLYPDVPYVMLAHSLGSVFARMYLQKYDDELDKLILSGAPNPVAITPIGLFLGNIRTFYGGEYGYSNLLELVTVKYGDGTWVSHSTANHAAIQSDPLMIWRFQARTNVMSIQAVDRMAKRALYQVKNPNLAILNVSGDEDHITGGEKGINETLAILQGVGYTNITNKVYPKMKHEIMNEDDKLIVFKDIVAFLEN